jgi:hypothetical protein
MLKGLVVPTSIVIVQFSVAICMYSECMYIHKYYRIIAMFYIICSYGNMEDWMRVLYRSNRVRVKEDFRIQCTYGVQSFVEDVADVGVPL